MKISLPETGVQVFDIDATPEKQHTWGSPPGPISCGKQIGLSKEPMFFFFFFRGVGNFEKKMGQCYQWRRAWNSKLLFSVWWRVAGKHEWGCVLCSCGRFDDPNSTLPLRCCMGCYYFDPLRRNAVLPHQARQVCFSALIRCAAREGPQAIEDTDHAVRMIGC